MSSFFYNSELFLLWCHAKIESQNTWKVWGGNLVLTTTVPPLLPRHCLMHPCFFFPWTLSPGKSHRIWQDPSWCHICKTQLSPILTTCQVINESIKMTTTLASNIFLPSPPTSLTPGIWERSWQHYAQTAPVMTRKPPKYQKQFSLIDWLIHHHKRNGQILQVKFCMCSESVFQ